MSIRIEDDLKLGGLVDAASAGGRDGLEKGADHIKDVAVAKAPLLEGAAALKRANKERRSDPGALRESAYVRVLDDVTAEIGFSEFYAGWQHERLDYHHEDGEAKFLEIPLSTEKDNVLQVIADAIRDAMSR